MNKYEKMMGFLESLSDQNPALIECVKQGYAAIHEAKKEDPEAAVRNKPNAVFDNESSLVNDNKDHFPLGSAAQARNALARVNQYSSVPKWCNCKSLEEMKKKVANAVKKEFPSIDVSEESYK